METVILNISKWKMLRRIIFILATAGFTSAVLFLYSYQLKGLVPSSNVVREFCICFGQIFFQATLLLLFKQKTNLIISYLYQMMSVSLIGAVLLLPVIVSSIVYSPFTFGSAYCLAYFFMVVLIMFLDHKKRVRKIEAPAWLTYTWVLYRLIVLAVIL
jgi:hypothetical protein